MTEAETTETEMQTTETETKKTETKDLTGAATALAAGAQELRQAGKKLEGGTMADQADAEIAQGLAEEAEDVYLRVKALHDRLELSAHAAQNGQ